MNANLVKAVHSTTMNKNREDLSILFQVFQRESLCHQCQKNWRTTKKKKHLKITNKIILKDSSFHPCLTINSKCPQLWFKFQVWLTLWLLEASTQTSTWVHSQCLNNQMEISSILMVLETCHHTWWWTNNNNIMETHNHSEVNSKSNSTLKTTKMTEEREETNSTRRLQIKKKSMWPRLQVPKDEVEVK